MTKRRTAGAVILLAAATTIACDRNGFNDDVPGAASLPPAFGARVTDGELFIWTGSRCQGITRLALTFDPNQEDRAEWVMTAPADRGADVEYLTVGQPPPGLDESEPLPSDFDWRRAESVRISVRGGDAGWGTTTYLSEVTGASADHPDNTYWFQDVGWLDPAEVADQDGKTFLATCTPNPA